MYTLKIYKIDIDLYLEKKDACIPMIMFDKTSHKLTVHDVTNLSNKKRVMIIMLFILSIV